MLDPQFLANIRSYLNESGNRALDSGIGSIIGSGTANMRQTQPSKPDPLTSGIQSGIGAVASQNRASAGNDDSKYISAIKEFMPIPRQMNIPSAGYRAGRDPEFNYGIGNPQTATDIRAYNMSLPQNIQAIAAAREAEAAKQSQPSNRSRSSSRDRDEPLVFAPRRTGPPGRDMENGYGSSSSGGLGSLVRSISSGIGNTISKIGGGISSLGNKMKYAEGGEIDTESMGVDQMAMPQEAMPEGLAALQVAQQPANEKDLISQAISAIKGEVEDPRPILGAFLAKYGEEALRNLVDKVESGDVDATAQQSQGQLRGAGDGMSDMIPAKAEGETDVLLSDGEYVVPADVVSGLGNGSSDAGSKQLDEMMARVREQRTGSREQAKQIQPKEAMPA
jgi:hypothetical protein